MVLPHLMEYVLYLKFLGSLVPLPSYSKGEIGQHAAISRLQIQISHL